MAERVVSVTLRAQVADYLAGMEKARKATSETGTEAEKLAQKKEGFDILGKASLAIGVAAAAGVALAVAKYAEFDQAMSNVNAAVQGTAEEQRKLSDAALEAGASTVFSATESANAIEELAKAGISTADVLSGALKGSLDLASAGQLGVARAAEISATALQQFKLDGDQASHVADVLAAGAGKAMGSVEDLANGLKFVGPVANSMGVSLEETTGVLALFAQQGIIGEQAGTSLRGVIASLTSPSSIAAKEIKRLGIEMYDSNGKFLGLENAAGELSKAYTGMDDASRAASMGVIFGRETITAATALYKAGATGVDEWTTAVDDSGYAAQVAKDRLDNLAGDVEALGGAFDTALIQTGAAGNEVLRAMTSTLTDVIDLYNDLPGPMQATVLAAGGVTAAVGLAGAAFFLGAPKVAQFNTALATLGPTAQKAGAALTASAGPVGILLAAAGVALAIFAGEQANAKARTDAFTSTLDAQTGALTESTEEMVRANLASEESFLWMSRGSAFDAAEKLGISLDDVTEAAMGNADAMDRIKDAYAEINDGSIENADAYKLLKDAINEQSGSLTDAERIQKQMSEAQTEGAETTDENADALEVLADAADDTGDSIEDLSERIRGFGDTVLDSREANRALEESYDSLTESVKENGTSLDIGEAKGRANEAAIDAIAQAAKEASAATLDQTGSQEQANAVMQAARDKLIGMLGQFGITGTAADEYADKLGLIPGNIKTQLQLDTEAAQAELEAWLAATNKRYAQPRIVPIYENGAKSTTGGLTQSEGSVLDFYANGGMRENHVAQIAPAGAWRVWAEDETGGEAYIPLAHSKRARSLDIWAETGKRLGVAGYSNGYMSPQYASAGASSTSVSVSPSVSLAGATLLATIDGQPIKIMIADQVASIDQSNARTLRRGRQV